MIVLILYGGRCEIILQLDYKALHVCCGKLSKSSCAYPAVSRLVHVALHLPGVGNQILHPSVLQSCRVRGGEYGLYSATEQQQFQQSIFLLVHFQIKKKNITNNLRQQGRRFQYKAYKKNTAEVCTYSLCTR